MTTTSARELIRRLATNNEPDPVRRVQAEMDRDRQLVAEAILEFLDLYFHGAETRERQRQAR